MCLLHRRYDLELIVLRCLINCGKPFPQPFEDAFSIFVYLFADSK